MHIIYTCDCVMNLFVFFLISFVFIWQAAHIQRRCRWLTRVAISLIHSFIDKRKTVELYFYNNKERMLKSRSKLYVCIIQLQLLLLILFSRLDISATEARIYRWCTAVAMMRCGGWEERFADARIANESHFRSKRDWGRSVLTRLYKLLLLLLLVLL